MPIRVVLERGPKDKKSVAFAVDWPGWSRGAKTADAAIETLEAYRERYRPVAVNAGLGKEFDGAGPLEVIEDRVGNSNTDYWGISFSPSSLEPDPMDADELERKIALLRGCWARFDEIAARVSPELRKGPRGGGWDRDTLIRHVIRNESERTARKVGLVVPEYAAMQPGGLSPYRSAYIEAMRAYQRGEAKRTMRSGTLAYVVRHTAYHTMDHTWEMDDRDLSGEPAG